MRTVDCLGTTIHAGSLDEAVALIRELAMGGSPSAVFFANTHFLYALLTDRRLRAAVVALRPVVFNDGVGTDVAASLQGLRLGANLNGTDLVPRVLKAGVTVGIVGGREQVVQAAAQECRRLGATVMFALSGYNLERTRVTAAVNSQRPELVLVGLGVPRQELLICECIGETCSTCWLAVGALVDFLGGAARRAPAYWRRAHLEWLWRLLHEPRRLVFRYTIEVLYVWIAAVRFGRAYQ